MVVPILQYIKKCPFLISVASEFDFCSISGIFTVLQVFLQSMLKLKRHVM